VERFRIAHEDKEQPFITMEINCTSQAGACSYRGEIDQLFVAAIMHALEGQKLKTPCQV